MACIGRLLYTGVPSKVGPRGEDRVSRTKRKSLASNSGSIVGLIFLVFLVLKLTGVVDWSWWWVTSPLWLAALATVGLLILAATIGFVIWRVVKRIRRKRAAAAPTEQP
jgi:hypothetical protein